MQKRPITNILKSRPKRTVYRDLDSDPEPGAHIVKRFHAPGVFQGLKDGLRAHREARGLRRWRSLGLPAPAPIAVRRRAKHWELVLESIPGARPLPEFLTQECGQTTRLGRVACQVGLLLAQMDRCGAVHGDPHPGNLLIDHEDRPWLIDPTPQPLFSRRATPGWSRWVHFCGQTRELCTPVFRAQVSNAYRKAQGTHPPPASESERQRLELLAREWRRSEVQARTSRWLRDSGATQTDGRHIYRNAAPQGSCRTETFATEEQAQRTWLAYARIHEHGLPAIQAKALRSTSSPTIESVVLHGLKPCVEEPDSAHLGRFWGRLHDRGLSIRLPHFEDLWGDDSGELYLDPSSTPILNSPAAPMLAPQIPAWVARACPIFVRAFVAQVGTTRMQLRELERVLRVT